jgi:curved DNA-binding protein CbpA
MTSFQEACAMFKVGDNTTWKEVKARYYALALKHHPDKGGLKEFFQRVVAAYELLDAHFKTNKTSHCTTGDVQCATSTKEEWTEDECFKQSNMTEAEFQEFLSRQKEEESFARRMKKKEAEREKAYFDSLKTDAEKQSYRSEQESSRLQAWVIGRENHNRMLRELISQNKPTADIPAYSHVLPAFKDSCFMNAFAAESPPSKQKEKRKEEQNHQRNTKRKQCDGISRKLKNKTSAETEKEDQENNKRIASRCSSDIFNNEELPPKAKPGTKKHVTSHPLTIDDDDEEQEIQFEQLGAEVLDSSTEQHSHRRNTQRKQHICATLETKCHQLVFFSSIRSFLITPIY